MTVTARKNTGSVEFNQDLARLSANPIQLGKRNPFQKKGKNMEIHLTLRILRKKFARQKYSWNK